MAGEKAATLKILGNNLDAKEKLKQIKEEADKLREESPELTVKIDKAQAIAEMAVLKEQLGSTGKPVEVPVEVKDPLDSFAFMAAKKDDLGKPVSFSIKGLPEALAKVEALDVALDKARQKAERINILNAAKGVKGAAGEFGGSLLGPLGLAAAAGPGIAGAGVIGAGALGVGASLGAATAGLGLFGATAKSVFSEYSTQISKVAEAQKNVANGDTGAKLAADLNQIHGAVKGLDPDVQHLVFSTANAETAWHNFVKNNSDGIANVLAPALDIIPNTLVKIQPLLAPVEGALTGIVKKVSAGINSSGFSNFIGTLAKNAGPDITKLADIFGHLGSIVGKVIIAFQPLGQGVLGGLDKILGKADAGTNSGIQKFLSWVSANGPQIVGILKNLASSALGIGKSFATFGSLNIGAFSLLASVLAKIASNPIGAGFLVGLLGLVKIIGVVGPLLKLVTAFKELREAINLAKLASIAFTGVGIIGVIILIVAAIVLLITHWNTVKKVAVQVWHDITVAVEAAFNWVKKNWPLLLGILLGPIALAAAAIFTHWHQIVDGAQWLLGKLESFFKSLPGRIVGALGNLGRLLWNAGVSILDGLLGGLLQKWHDITSFVSGIAGWISSHKGPISYDATLLKPHGLAIMGGLVGGLEGGLPSLTRQLTKTTQTIANTKVGGIAGSNSAAMTIEWVGGSGADREFLTWLKKNIRINGGDPGVIGR